MSKELPTETEGWLIWIRDVLDQIESGALTISQVRQRIFDIQKAKALNLTRSLDEIDDTFDLQ